MAAPAASAQRWLFGPASDLLLGCGVLYMGLLLAFGAAGPQLREMQPNYLLPLLVLLFSMPHYGATLVRVYDRRADRRGYIVFSVWATIAVAVAFVVGLYDSFVGSLLMTVYLTWSPWHYTGQNYGIAVMFLRRRGVALPPGAKRLLYASFILSYVLVFIVFHTTAGASAYGLDAPTGSDLQFLRMGLPYAVSSVVFPAAAGAYAVCLASAAFLLVRGAQRLRDLLPAAVLTMTQALWFAIPYCLRHWDLGIGFEPFDYHFAIRDYVLWIAIGHAVQYLWVTTYYARGSSGWRGYASYLGKVGAAGVAIWTLPVVLFAPDFFGPRAYNAGLAMMVASAVNIHHFILDGAIWKLRNMKIANILIRRSPEAAVEAEAAEAGGGWLRRGVWGVAALSLVAALFIFWEKELAYSAAFARGDYEGASAILDRMAWLGRDNAANRRNLGLAAARNGKVDLAIHNYRRVAAIGPTARSYAELGAIFRVQQDWESALATYLSGLELDGEDPQLLRGAGIAQLELGRPQEAIPYLERVLERYPKDEITLATLERARQLLAANAT